MHKVTMVMTTIFAVLVTGCVPSLQPIYTDKDLVYDPGLVGTWRLADSKWEWTFTRTEEKAYRLVQTDATGKSGEFSAHLVNIEGSVFLDLHPEKPSVSGNVWYAAHFQPVHTFLLVRRIDPELCRSIMNRQWLFDYLRMNPNAVRHELTEGGGVVLTATTKELQAFVADHAKTKEAWHALLTMKLEPHQ